MNGFDLIDVLWFVLPLAPMIAMAIPKLRGRRRAPIIPTLSEHDPTKSMLSGHDPTRSTPSGHDPTRLTPSGHDPTRSTLTRDVFVAVQEQLARGRRIQAMKVLRERTGMRLVEAKDLVDAINAGRLARSQPETEGLTPSVPAASTPPPGDLAQSVRTLRDAGREAEAMRMVCEQTGMVVRDAQKFVRALD